MGALTTRNYFQKRVIHFLFNEKWYNRIKLFKIITHYKFGLPYEMSPMLKHIINRDSVVLDIGANMGQFACRLNDIVSKGSGHVHSFEPVEANFSSLQSMQKILNMKSVTINRLGISNIEEDAVINIPIFNNGLIVGTRATLLELNEIKHRSEKIKITTIDRYIAEKMITHIDFIKCDTEGNENKVLEGGKEAITKHLPVLSFEMSYEDKGLNWLLDLGYEMFYFDSKFNKLRKVEDRQSGNLILVNKKQQKKFNRIFENQ